MDQQQQQQQQQHHHHQQQQQQNKNDNIQQHNPQQQQQNQQNADLLIRSTPDIRSGRRRRRRRLRLRLRSVDSSSSSVVMDPVHVRDGGRYRYLPIMDDNDNNNNNNLVYTNSNSHQLQQQRSLQQQHVFYKVDFDKNYYQPPLSNVNQQQKIVVHGQKVIEPKKPPFYQSSGYAGNGYGGNGNNYNNNNNAYNNYNSNNRNNYNYADTSAPTSSPSYNTMYSYYNSGNGTDVSVWHYTLFVCCSLMMFVSYLALPKGVRKQYFKANRKRYNAATPSSSKYMNNNSVTSLLPEHAMANNRWLLNNDNSYTDENYTAHSLSLGHSIASSRTSSIHVQNSFLKEIERRRILAATDPHDNNNIHRNVSTNYNENDDLDSLLQLDESLQHSKNGYLQVGGAEHRQNQDHREGLQQYEKQSYAGIEEHMHQHEHQHGYNNHYDHDFDSALEGGVQRSYISDSNMTGPKPFALSSVPESEPAPHTPPRIPNPQYSKPSPEHPAIPTVPRQKVLDETMRRLKGRGIRLLAHGVASDCKRVWIRIEDRGDEYSDNDENPNPTSYYSLTWQTEFPRKVPNSSGEVTIVLMRGTLHRIALPNILFIDVGKKTNAFRKNDNQDITDTVCFSLLTQNGSLDLQANSRLERDALVGCFSIILDEVHNGQDWRLLYAGENDSSVAGTSSIAGASSTTRNTNSTLGGTLGTFVTNANTNNTNTSTLTSTAMASHAAKSRNHHHPPRTPAPSLVTSIGGTSNAANILSGTNNDDDIIPASASVCSGNLSDILFDSDMVEI